MFSATESEETSCSSCGMTAMPASIASRGLVHPPRLAVDADLAAVLRDLAREDPDQRRLARAVLADESVDLSRPHVEVHAVERPHPRELHRHAARLDERGHGVRPAFFGVCGFEKPNFQT